MGKVRVFFKCKIYLERVRLIIYNYETTSYANNVHSGTGIFYDILEKYQNKF